MTNQDFLLSLHSISAQKKPPTCAATVASVGAALMTTQDFRPHPPLNCNAKKTPPNCAATVASVGAALITTQGFRPHLPLNCI